MPSLTSSKTEPQTGSSKAHGKFDTFISQLVTYGTIHYNL